MIPITERFLSECGGWQALKEARSLHAAGRVVAASYVPPLLEGRVKEGAGELRSGLRITSKSHVESLCVCRLAKREGIICAHALAVGLEWLNPRAAPEKEEAISQITPPNLTTESGSTQFTTDDGELLELHVVLPPNFPAAWERNAITVGVEAGLQGRRVLISAIAPTKRYQVSPGELRALTKIRALADGDLPGVITLDRTAFLELLPTLTEHPRVTFAKTTPATIHSAHFRPDPDLPAGSHLLATGSAAWLLNGFAFQPLQPAPVEAGATESDGTGTAPPRFALDLEGSLNHLAGRLDALYTGHRFTVEATPRASAAPRHHPAERQALDRLLASGFTGPDRTGQFTLKGEPAVLAFFARDLPRLEKEWAVTIGTRFAHVTRDIERIQPRLEIRASGENWFDLKYELATPNGDRFSATEIQRLLQSGQSSTRLKNRKLAVFDSELLNEFQEALTDCNPQQNQPGFYRIERRNAPFLQDFAAEQGGGLSTDSAWAGWTQLAKSDPAALEPLGPLDSILRPYQKEGVKWLKNLFNNGLNGILADEMGLGKTVQTLAFLSETRGKALVVCPSSLIFNWEREANHFTPNLRTLCIQGSERGALFGESMKNADLVITSYALLRRDIDRYQDADFATVILDEAQHIKNPDSQNAQSAFSLRAKRRIVLTGTPLENSLADIWSLMNFLMPGYLGTRVEFRERFQRPIEQAPGGAAHKRLIQRLKPCILRRLKRSVLTELPDKIEHVAYCELTVEQREVYLKIANSARQQASEWSDAKDQAKARMFMLTALLRLRQVCCDLRLLNLSAAAESLEPSGKLQMLGELLEEAIDGDHRVLIFSQFTSMLRILRETLEREQVSLCYLDGQTKDRASVVDRFQSGAARVFLISLKAGGTGLNLTSADTVIHFDPWWNPAVENQATDRAHRIGQKRVVTSYKLISRDTVEEKILALQNRKRSVIDSTLDQDEPLMGGLSTDEIRELLA